MPSSTSPEPLGSTVSSSSESPLPVKSRSYSTTIKSTPEYLKMMQKEKFRPPNLSEAAHPPLPPKRVRRKNGLPVQPVPRSAKPPGELLTADEKNANHIASEQKRRKAIREGFEKITEAVPDLDKAQGRSEATVLIKTVRFLQNLIEENKMLVELAEAQNTPLPTDQEVKEKIDETLNQLPSIQGRASSSATEYDSGIKDENEGFPINLKREREED